MVGREVGCPHDDIKALWRGGGNKSTLRRLHAHRTHVEDGGLGVKECGKTKLIIWASGGGKRED